eukprot:m51a1_g12969 putative pathogenesis-related protein 4 (151) ;mRNA; r:2194-2892
MNPSRSLLLVAIVVLAVDTAAAALHVNYQAQYWRQQQAGNVNGLMCQDALAGHDRSYFTRYPYIAYLYATQSNCGKCVRLTSISTGAVETFRIVDLCGGAGHIGDVEWPAFDGCSAPDPTCYQGWAKLDTNGAGYQAGHIDVTASEPFYC